MPNDNDQLKEKIEFLLTRLFLVFLPVYAELLEKSFPKQPEFNRVPKKMLETYVSLVDNLITYAFLPPITNTANSEAIQQRLKRIEQQLPIMRLDSNQFWRDKKTEFPHFQVSLPNPNCALACDLIKQLLGMGYLSDSDLVHYLPSTVDETQQLLLTLYDLLAKNRINSPNSASLLEDLTSLLSSIATSTDTLLNRKSSFELVLLLLHRCRFSANTQQITSNTPTWIKSIKNFNMLWEHDDGTQSQQELRELAVRFMHALGYIEPYMTAQLLGINLEQASTKIRCAFMIEPQERLFTESRKLFANDQNSSHPADAQQKPESTNPAFFAAPSVREDAPTGNDEIPTDKPAKSNCTIS